MHNLKTARFSPNFPPQAAFLETFLANSPISFFQTDPPHLLHSAVRQVFRGARDRAGEVTARPKPRGSDRRDLQRDH